MIIINAHAPEKRREENTATLYEELRTTVQKTKIIHKYCIRYYHVLSD
jgi:hypothetical protein